MGLSARLLIIAQKGVGERIGSQRLSTEDSPEMPLSRLPGGDRFLRDSPTRPAAALVFGVVCRLRLPYGVLNSVV